MTEATTTPREAALEAARKLWPSAFAGAQNAVQDAHSPNASGSLAFGLIALGGAISLFDAAVNGDPAAAKRLLWIAQDRATNAAAWFSTAYDVRASTDNGPIIQGARERILAFRDALVIAEERC